MTPLDFMSLFAEFRAASWHGWRQVLARLTPDVREFYGIIGRGAGKSRIVALLACFYASREYRRAPGENIYVGIFAPDRKQAGVTFRYVVGLLNSVPALAALIVSESKDSVELSNGVIIEVITASVSAPRGRSYAVAIIEEAAFLDDEDSANPDVELLRALRPALARVPGSLLAVVSSPYARKGIVFDAWTKHHDGTDARVLVIQRATRDLNPTFDQQAIDTALAEDEASARAEYLAEFRSDVENLLSGDRLDAVTERGVFELPLGGLSNVRAFVDPSGGSSDSFTLGIAGTNSGGIHRLMLVREWKPPFSPADVVGEAVDVVRAYKLSVVTGDAYSGEFVRELFSKQGVRYEVSPKNRSGIYLDGLALINSKRCRLLDDARLRKQLLGLERRVGRTSDVIDHKRGAHDDVANAAIGALTVGAINARSMRVWDAGGGGLVHGFDQHGCEWRNGKPYNGTLPEVRDGKGRVVVCAMRFADGKWVG
jgi:hypothetical protein